ncbi:MAG TPA: AAC(3) family N-acetyltransferase [Luteibacter sp.]|nr:AAC(3) family N-acetyltransferase [Luteibacter sp.]
MGESLQTCRVPDDLERERHRIAQDTEMRTTMPRTSAKSVDALFLQQELETLGLPRGAVVIVHSSLSAFGAIEGGPRAVVDALRYCVGDSGTVVVPTFTPQVSDPYPQSSAFGDAQVEGARRGVPLFRDALPTPMGAVANAVLAHPERLRGNHPQASVAALGARAREITADQPLAYALGKNSPFERMYGLGAYILLLGVGHNRNSFLHYAESLTSCHRTKLRRFPYVIQRERLWVEAPDVGDDNGTYFPLLGSEADAAGLIRHKMIGSAPCQLIESRPFVDFARLRLEALLAETA